MSSNFSTFRDLPNPESVSLISNQVPKSWVHFFFPNFRRNSFIFYVSAVEALIYLISLFFGSTRLEVNHGNVLAKIGCKQGSLIVEGQLWRLVTPIFIHANIWHLIGNLYVQCSFGFSIEKEYGAFKTALLYFGSGLFANLFATATNPCSTSVGASTAVFGFIGFQILTIIYLWKSIHDKANIIYTLLFNVLILVVNAQARTQAIDHYGHLGGFLAGFFIGMIYCQKIEVRPEFVKKRGVCIGITGLSFLVFGSLATLIAFPLNGPNGRCTRV